MAVIVVREYEGNRADITIPVLAGVANAAGESPSAAAGYAVYPLLSGGIFDNDTGLTNTGAVWQVMSENPLDGAFSYRNGGGFTYATGDQSGTASFVYKITDFDGLGTDTQATVRVTVHMTTAAILSIAVPIIVYAVREIINDYIRRKQVQRELDDTRR